MFLITKKFPLNGTIVFDVRLPEIVIPIDGGITDTFEGERIKQ